MSADYFEQAQAYRDQLLRVLEDYLARLRELDAVPVEERARVTYSAGNLTYSWSEYRSSLWEGVKATMESLQQLATVFPVELRIKVQ